MGKDAVDMPLGVCVTTCYPHVSGACSIEGDRAGIEDGTGGRRWIVVETMTPLLAKPTILPLPMLATTR